MSLRRKALLTIGIMIGILIAILYISSRTIVLKGFAELERRSAWRNVERVLNILSDELSSLDELAYDWAAWDDTYAFIEDANQTYIKANLVDETFTGIRLNLMLFINASRQIVFGKAFDLQKEEEIPVPQSFLELISADDFLLRHPNPESSITGLVLLPEAPLLVASRPILTSKDEGPIRGTLIMGRYLDSAQIERLAKIARLPLSIYRFEDPQIPPDFQGVRSSLSEEAQILVRPLSPESVAGYALLKDIYGKPSLILRADMPREIYHQGKATISYFTLLLLAVALTFGVATLLLLEGQVLSRLTGLSKRVSSIGASGDLSARVAMTGKDELSSLADAINEMLEGLERAEAARWESERRYKILFENTLAGVIVIDAQTMKVVLGNQAAAKMYGFDSVEEAIGVNPLDFVHPDDRDRVRRIIEEDMFEKDLRQINEFRTITKGGREVWVAAVGTRTEYQGRLAGLVSIMDITERKRAEEELIRLSGAVRMSIDSIVISDLEGKIVGVNEATLKMYGTDDKGDLIGKSSFDLIAPEDRERAFAGMEEVLEKGSIRNREYHIITKNGSTIPVEMSVAIMKDPGGKPVGFVAISRDITERKRAEAEIQQRNKELLALQRVTAAVHSTLDLDEILQQVADGIVEGLDYHTVIVFLLDEDDDVLKGRAISTKAGFAERIEGIIGCKITELKIPVGEDGNQAVREAAKGEVEIRRSLAEVASPPLDEGTCSVLEGLFGSKSFILLPFMVRGQGVGGILVTSPREGLTDREEELLLSFVHQASTAIENAWLYESVAGQLSQMEALERVSERINMELELSGALKAVAEASRQVLGADRCAIHLVEKETETVYCTFAEGLSDEYVEMIDSRYWEIPGGKVLATGEPMVISDAQKEARVVKEMIVKEGIRSMALLPLLYRGETIGVLGLYHDRKKAYGSDELALAQVFANQAAIAIENARLYEERQRRLDELSALGAIATAVHQSLELEEVYQMALDKVMEVTDIDAVDIYLVDERTNEAVLQAHRGYSEEYVRRAGRIEYPRGATWQVIESGEVFVTGDVQKESRIGPAGKDEGLNSLLSIPIRSKGKVIGVIDFKSYKRDHFDPHKVSLLSTIGDQIGTAVAQAKLYEDSRRALLERKKLHSVSLAVSSSFELENIMRMVVDSAILVTGSQRAAILLLDAEEKKVQQVAMAGSSEEFSRPVEEPRADGLTWTVIERKGPVVVRATDAGPPALRPEDMERGIKAVIGLPLKTKERVFGALVVNTTSLAGFTDDEMEVLSILAEQAAVAIENARLYQEAQRGLTERKRLLAELEAQNRELESFVYTISHDLRTPLISLGGFSSLLQKEFYDRLGEQGKHYLERIQANVAHMDDLVTDLLELSRIGRAVGTMEEIEVAALLREIQKDMAVELREAGAEFVVQEPLPVVRADRGRIRQVFVNLIGNAIKFRSEERPLRIEVGCREEGGFYRFSVADNGIGIDPQYQEQIFDLFQQLDAEAEGVGIGLTLVKKIVEHHGGRVWVESGSGNGSTFYFTIPVSSNQ